MSRETEIDRYRYFLKDTIRRRIDFSQTAQSQGLPAPPIEKPVPDDAERIELLRPDAWGDIGHIDLATAIARRESRRRFTQQPLSLAELSFLLWATQGLRQPAEGGTALRTVPSAGARHAFETYLYAANVETLDAALYRYLPLEHQLTPLFEVERAAAKITEATLGQSFVATAPVVFIWTTIPYRMEWRYGLAAHKVLAIDAGHVCQNLYLACEAIGAGTCAVAAYHQEQMDALVQVDGEDEFVVYLAPVGRV